MPDSIESTGTTHEVPSRRVLIVDDAAGIATITARLFALIGHETMVALNGKSALETHREFASEIVLLDLVLPDMSGFDVARAIREADSVRRTLIVAQTGHADQENRQKAFDAGFDEYLVKPVDVADLKKLGSHPKLSEINGIH